MVSGKISLAALVSILIAASSALAGGGLSEALMYNCGPFSKNGVEAKGSAPKIVYLKDAESGQGGLALKLPNSGTDPMAMLSGKAFYYEVLKKGIEGDDFTRMDGDTYWVFFQNNEGRGVAKIEKRSTQIGFETKPKVVAYCQLASPKQ